MKTYICKYCKKEFQRKGRRIPVFCSRKCKAEYAKKMSGSTRICLVCKNEFYVKGNPRNRGIYCSRKCAATGRIKGKIIKCGYCGKEVYKYRVHLRNHKDHFCSRVCANRYQARKKKKMICKICRKKVDLSKSSTRLYCTWECRLKDKESIRRNAIKGNLVQQKKKGLNKLELAGRKILRDLKIEFNEQILMFDKFLVDILLKNRRIIIQWDGNYWHSNPKRVRLDKSQDAYFKKCGYKVLRFWETDIKKNKENVIADIKKAI